MIAQITERPYDLRVDLQNLQKLNLSNKPSSERKKERIGYMVEGNNRFEIDYSYLDLIFKMDGKLNTLEKVEKFINDERLNFLLKDCK